MQEWSLGAAFATCFVGKLVRAHFISIGGETRNEGAFCLFCWFFEDFGWRGWKRRALDRVDRMHRLQNCPNPLTKSADLLNLSDRLGS